MNNKPWEAIFNTHRIYRHKFRRAPFEITAEQIKQATRRFKHTNEKEVRILCKQDTRESRPKIFQELGLFILPIRNGTYSILEGEGYVDIPPIRPATKIYTSQLDFSLDTISIGNSEMQLLDFAYAASLIRTFLKDPSLVLTIRGRKYTPEFDLHVGKHKLQVASVQTEVDAGYEGKRQVVLIEAKNFTAPNVIIRQLYYPLRQWTAHTNKAIKTIFFEQSDGEYSLWQFDFTDPQDYNSISLVQAQRFHISDKA